MARYLSIRPRSDDGDLYEVQMGFTVHEQDASPIKTGLLDAQGTPIYRVEERAPLGFQSNRWKS